MENIEMVSELDMENTLLKMDKLSKDSGTEIVVVKAKLSI